MGYKIEQKTPVGFVSAFDKKLIWLVGVQHATNSTKVFLQRSLVILQENGKRHQEALSKVASLEAEVAKWRAITRKIRRVECPEVASATVTFPEAVKSNHKMSSKVGSVLAKLLHTTLDGDEMFKRCKVL